MKRRDFIGLGGALLAGGLSACQSPSAIPPGRLGGAGFGLGHRLRTPDFPSVSETRKIPLVIAGGGVAGLSAGWQLQRSGFKDFLLIEMEDAPGGNSRGGENPVSRHPLGAHYLPLPGPGARYVRELLADLGVLQGDAYAIRPRYDERYVVAAPQERLFHMGRWQEGLIPQLGQSAGDRERIARFYGRVAEWKRWRDKQGRPAFAVPMALSSPDPALLALDRMSFGQWLTGENLSCEPLHWYLDYACRDDYGTGIDQTSAWAGLHYFASRDGEGEGLGNDLVLTAPEGNGWIVERLAVRLAERIMTGALVHRVQINGGQIRAQVYLAAEHRTVEYVAQHLIWAAPVFVLARVWADAPSEISTAAKAFDYAPWTVANLTLSEAPGSGTGAPLAWDNVLHGSSSLGYVVATHQQMQQRPGPTVITHYQAHNAGPASAWRKRMLENSRESWARDILTDLARAHPEIQAITRNLDVFHYGHAMIRPHPGLITSPLRRRLGESFGPVQLAHADLSGISIFEEAQYRGVSAANRILRFQGGHA